MSEVKSSLFRSESLLDFVEDLRCIEKRGGDSDSLFVESLNARRLLNEIGSGEKCVFVVYSNDEVGVGYGDVSVVVEEFGWESRELSN